MNYTIMHTDCLRSSLPTLIVPSSSKYKTDAGVQGGVFRCNIKDCGSCGRYSKWGQGMDKDVIEDYHEICSEIKEGELNEIIFHPPDSGWSTKFSEGRT